jgi:hypothetical protein
MDVPDISGFLHWTAARGIQAITRALMALTKAGNVDPDQCRQIMTIMIFVKILFLSNVKFVFS